MLLTFDTFCNGGHSGVIFRSYGTNSSECNRELVLISPFSTHFPFLCFCALPVFKVPPVYSRGLSTQHLCAYQKHLSNNALKVLTKIGNCWKFLLQQLKIERGLLSSTSLTSRHTANEKNIAFACFPNLYILYILIKHFFPFSPLFIRAKSYKINYQVRVLA